MNSCVEIAGAVGVGSSAVLGFLWVMWGVFLIAWIVVFMAWIRQLMRWGDAYRKYEQGHREYQQACGKYQKSDGQFSEELRLIQKRLHESNIKSGGGKVQKLPVPGVRKVVDEKLNISGGSSVKPKSNLIMPRLLKRVICNVCGFFGCHKTKGVDKQPNESKLSHADERDVDSSGGVQ